MDDGGPPTVDAHDLHLTYRAGDEAPVRALRGLDLVVAAGEHVAVVGPSGSGKTSLVNSIAGLVVPERGTITVAGRAIEGDDDTRARLRRDLIGIVFQDHRLIDSLSAVDNVALAMRIAGLDPDTADVRARDLLALVALGARAESAIDSLSGGQRQRVAVARALANDPAVVLADEPTGALDSDGRDEIAELFTRLRSPRRSFVIVTHDRILAETADRIERMEDGRLDADAVAMS